jgi:hypothetical protein
MINHDPVQSGNHMADTIVSIAVAAHGGVDILGYTAG